MKKLNFLLSRKIAHRGIHNKYIENTIPAFKEAIKNNYIIELDVRLTKDKKIIVYHDHNLKRIFEIDRDIKDLTLKEIKKYKYISTLQEVLEEINNQTPIIIDIKSNLSITKKLIKILDNYKGNFTIQSYNPIILYIFKIYRKNYITGYLIYNFLYTKHIINIIKPDYLITNLKNLDNISVYRKKYPLIGYTIKTEEEYNKYKNYADNFVYDISK